MSVSPLYWPSVWSKKSQRKHTPLYKKDTKWNHNKPMETTQYLPHMEIFHKLLLYFWQHKTADFVEHFVLCVKRRKTGGNNPKETTKLHWEDKSNVKQFCQKFLKGNGFLLLNNRCYIFEKWLTKFWGTFKKFNLP